MSPNTAGVSELELSAAPGPIGDRRIKFEILWYEGEDKGTSLGAAGYGPNRIIARDYVLRADLTAAITAACNMLKAGKGGLQAANKTMGNYAHGFYVRKAS